MALKPTTPIEPYADIITEFDMILLMTVEPGFGGQSFLDSVLPKIRRTRELVRKTGQEIWIQVDGGVSVDTIGRAAEAGADVFVAGTAVYRAGDPDAMVIGDSKPTDQPTYDKRFGKPFEPVRQETFAWLRTQDLIVMPFNSGPDELGLGSLLIFALHPVASQCMNGLGCQTQMCADRNAPLHQKTHHFGGPAPAFELDHVRTGLHQHRSAAQGLFFGFLVAAKRQVANQPGGGLGAVQAACHALGVVTHVI